MGFVGPGDQFPEMRGKKGLIPQVNPGKPAGLGQDDDQRNAVNKSV